MKKIYKVTATLVTDVGDGEWDRNISIVEEEIELENRHEKEKAQKILEKKYNKDMLKLEDRIWTGENTFIYSIKDIHLIDIE